MQSSQEHKKARLIIRNLVFDVNQSHLKKLLSPFGTVSEINIPVNQANGKPKGFAFAQFENKNQAERAVKALNQTKYKGRQLLVDFSVDIRQYQQFKSEMAGEMGESEQKNETEKKDQKISQDIQEESEHSEDKYKEEKAQKKKEFETPQKKRYDDSDMSDTIFVRSIPYEATEESFKLFFQKFGSIIYAKLCKNRMTDTPNGTGFVKFTEALTAKNLLIQSKTPSKLNRTTVNELEMNGRLLVCLPAVQRGEVPIKEDKEDKKKVDIKKIHKLDEIIKTDRQDKRHLNLSNIGSFKPTPDMNDQEKQKFQQHYQEKVQKLKNPNHYVSDTRILMKNLPKRQFDEEDLKKIIEKFKETIKVGHKKIVKQIKCLVDKDKTDKDTGAPMIKGIAFIDFNDHESAKGFIEYIVANSKKVLKQRPIIEFAVEDARHMKKREDQKALKTVENEENKVKESKTERVEKQAAHKKDVDKNKNNAQANIYLLKEKIKENGTEKEIKELLYGIKVRGIRQRAKKLVSKHFGRDVFQTQTDKNSKQDSKEDFKQNSKQDAKQDSKLDMKKQDSKLDKKQIKKQDSKLDKNSTQDVNKKATQELNKKIKEKKKVEKKQERTEINKIKKDVKKKQELKKRHLDEDEFDLFAKDYAAKLEKRLKWSSNDKGDAPVFE